LGFAAALGSTAGETAGPEPMLGDAFGVAAGFVPVWDCWGAWPLTRPVEAWALAPVDPAVTGAVAAGVGAVAGGGAATRVPEEEGRVRAGGGGTTTFAPGGVGPPGAPAARGGGCTEPESSSTAIAAAPSRTATAAAATTPDLVTPENALPLRGSLADTGLPPPSFLLLGGGI
jgi:hypothetical protein